MTLWEAFQIADDLDVEGDSVVVGGEATGKDAAAEKATMVSILGVAGARSTTVMVRVAQGRCASRRSSAPLGQRSSRPPAHC